VRCRAQWFTERLSRRTTAIIKARDLPGTPNRANSIAQFPIFQFVQYRTPAATDWNVVTVNLGLRK